MYHKSNRSKYLSNESHGPSTFSRASVVLLISFVTLIAGFSLVEARISPDRLVLNSIQGNADDVQATIPRIIIPYGYRIIGSEAILQFDGVEVAQSSGMRYIPITDILIVNFDKIALLTNDTVEDMAGEKVTATVVGWFTVEDADGNTYTQDFGISDQVDIIGSQSEQ